MTVIDLDKRRADARDRKRKSRLKLGEAVQTPHGIRSTCSICGDQFFAPRRNVRVCGDGQCDKVAKRQRLRPFTIQHFKKWASSVILDTEEPWKVEPFQEAFLIDVFSGIPECWLLIPEGNTKTTTLAGLGLYEIQFRRGGRVPVAASSRDQAFEMYLQAQGMVERTPELAPVFTCHEGLRQIKCESMAGRMQVYAADDRTGDGAIFTKALVDELHRHRDLRLYRTWSGKLGKRKGAQLLGISTAGEAGSDFEETRAQIKQRATDVARRGGLTVYKSSKMVLHEYAVDAKADVKDMKVVKAANPFSGVTVATLKEKFDSPTMQMAHWRRFTCNLATRAVGSAITEAEWFRQRCDVRIPEGFSIWAGLDVAWKWDTTALVPLWIPQESDYRREEFPLDVLRGLQELQMPFWSGSLAPEESDEGSEGAEEASEEVFPAAGEFMLLGEATILEPPRDGNSLDPDDVEDALLTLHERNPIHTLVMDTTRAEQLSTWAERNLGCEVVDRAQSNALAALDYERWMEGLRQRTLWHQGDAGLSSHVFNAVTRLLDGSKARFERPKQPRQVAGQEQQRRRVIDALTAASMVVCVAVADVSEDTGVVYG